jgi:geranylgeranyl diphosphate synthase type II
MSTIEELTLRFLAYLKEQRFIQRPKELYEPVNYIMELGGKRMRPVMLLMSYELFGSQLSHALPAAYAIEIFHNFSLVHDDIMDQAPLRRGRPTVHTRYDINTGILSGDVMLIYAYDYLTKIGNPEKLAQVIKLFNETSIKVCEGQQWDINFEQREDVTIEEYIKMISYKTAALLAGGMKIGALIGGATEEDAELVYNFAWNTGIAFQLQDDILDTFGDPDKFGKKVGGDIVQNKKTYLVLRALELAGPETKTKLTNLMNTQTINEEQKIDAVKGIFRRLNIMEEAEKMKERYQALAFEALASIEVEQEKKEPLTSIANQLLAREV